MAKVPKKKIYSKTEARYNFPNLVNRVRDSGDLIYITDRGRASAVLVSYEQFESGKFLKPAKKKKKFSETGLAGLWADRKDAKDSVEWVNKLRKREGTRTKRFFEELENEPKSTN